MVFNAQKSLMYIMYTEDSGILLTSIKSILQDKIMRSYFSIKNMRTKIIRLLKVQKRNSVHTKSITMANTQKISEIPNKFNKAKHYVLELFYP